MKHLLRVRESPYNHPSKEIGGQKGPTKRGRGNEYRKSSSNGSRDRKCSAGAEHRTCSVCFGWRVRRILRFGVLRGGQKPVRQLTDYSSTECSE